MGEISEESLLDYMFKEGGKVKNADLLKTYKQFISHSDQQLRAKYREEFKLIIDRIAVVKSENGEKYLVLKKKYRQQVQERESERASDSDRPRVTSDSPPAPVSMVQWEGGEVSSQSRVWVDPRGSSPKKGLCPPTSGPVGEPGGAKKTALVSWCGGPAITITEAPENDASEEGQQSAKTEQLSLSVSEGLESSEPPSPQAEDSPSGTDGEDQPDRDTDSKSELEAEPEQEEEGSGSIGSNSVALDPLEKEWLHSAACGRLSHLSELLKQEPALASKKDFTSTALHWAAKHGIGDMATLVVDAGADVNIKAGYTPLHIASLHGHRHIVELLVRTYGAKENVRDYSGHLPCHYLDPRDAPGEDTQLGFQVAQSGERRNRKLAALFHPKSSGGARKKWGSVEDLAEGGEERMTSHQLALPAFRTRKFSR